MDGDMRYAIEGLIIGLRRAGVITEEHLPFIAQGICDAGKKGRSGTAWRCNDLAAELTRCWANGAAGAA